MTVRHLDDEPRRSSPSTTGLQMMVADFAASLDAAERTATPQEYAVLVDLIYRLVAREMARIDWENWR
jgi:hypothetical protein